MWAVLDYTRTRTIERELLLAKISILGPEYFMDQLANKGPDILPASEGLEEGSPARIHADATLRAAGEIHPRVDAESHAPRLSPSEALRQKHQHLSGIELIAKQFGGKLVDVSSDAVIVEMTGKTQRVDAFLKLVRPYGILEAARSGLMVMPRGEGETFPLLVLPHSLNPVVCFRCWQLRSSRLGLALRMRRWRRTSRKRLTRRSSRPVKSKASAGQPPLEPEATVSLCVVLCLGGTCKDQKKQNRDLRRREI